MTDTAPRFEIVHKPRVYDGHDGAEPNDQPWSARFIGANGEEMWRTSESYVDVRDAEHALSLLADALGSQALLEGTTPVKDSPRPPSLPIVRVEVGP